MKICFVQYNLGAKSETFLTRHINLLKNDFDVSCITGKVHDKTILEPTKVYDFTKMGNLESLYKRLLNRFKKNSFLYSSSIFKGIEEIKPDLVVFQFAFLPVLCVKQVLKLDVPFVIIHHGTDLNKARVDHLYREKLKLIWEKASSVVFISSFLYKEGLKLGVDNIKAKMIYLGVPLKNKIKKQKKDKLFHVLSIGRLELVKNQGFLIKAFKIFNDKYPKTKLTIIGDGSEKDNLKQLVFDLELIEHVFFTGALDFTEVESYLHNADVFSLTSKKIISNGSIQEEGLPISLIEASVNKLPMIATRTGGVPEIVYHRETGLLVDPDNTYELYEALEYLYLNKDKAVAIGEKAYKLVLNRFDQNQQIKKFKALYLKSTII